MSLICQNFVQNTWRKDLCSNCFKSLTDHGSYKSVSNNSNNEILHINGNSRYVPQTSTIYQTRNLINHRSWRSLLDESDEKLKSLKINNRTQEQSQNIHKENGYSKEEISVNIEKLKNDYNSKDRSSNNHRSILKTSSTNKNILIRKSNVGFADDEAQVIGYGGNDYTSDEDASEDGSDHDSGNNESLDISDEDHAITKITKENTEFNSLNINLSEELRNTRTDVKQAKICVPEEDKQTDTENNCHNDNKILENKQDSKLPEIINSKAKQLKKQIENENIKNYSKTTGSYSFIRNDSNLPNNSLINCNKQLVTNNHLPNYCNGDVKSTADLATYTEIDISHVMPIDTLSTGSSDSDTSSAKQTSDEYLMDSDSNQETELNDHSQNVSARNNHYSDNFINEHKSNLVNITKQINKVFTLSDDMGHENTLSSSTDFFTVSDDSDSQGNCPNNVKVSSGNLNSSEKLRKNSFSKKAHHHQNFPVEENSKSLKPNPPKKYLQRQNAITSSECINASNNTNRYESSNHYAVSPSIHELNKNCRNSEKDNSENSGETISSIESGMYVYAKHEDLASFTEKDILENKSSRESKLAALALELERARCDSIEDSKDVHSLPIQSLDYVTCTSSVSATPVNNRNSNSSDSSSYSYSSPGSNNNTSNYMFNGSSGRSHIPSSAHFSRLSFSDTWSDITSKKKIKFSIKKLLKRSKEHTYYYGSGECNSPNFSNAKAWKNNEYDIAKLRMQIIHPMDMLNGSNSNRGMPEKSYLECSLPDTSEYDDSANVVKMRSQSRERSPSVNNSSPPGNQKKTTYGTSKTESMQRSPIYPSTSIESSKNGSNHQRPPKPPPPPRTPRSLLPVSQSNSNVTNGKNFTPKRPPPPKISGNKKHSVCNSTNKAKNLRSKNDIPKEAISPVNTDYANLGDVRSLIAPKKPERSAVTPPKQINSNNVNGLNAENEETEPEDNTYETVKVVEEEEDHYSYLDESDMKPSSLQDSGRHKTTISILSHKPIQSSTPNSQLQSNWEINRSSTSYPSDISESAECKLNSSTTSNAVSEDSERKPWCNVDDSYAAIVSANYEALVDLVTNVIQERGNQLQKSDGGYYQWSDFSLESEQPIKVIDDKIIYNANFKYGSKIPVTLLVTTQKLHVGQSIRNSPTYPLLCFFSDYLPRHYVSGQQSSHSDLTKVWVFVLQKSVITTLKQFPVLMSTTGGQTIQNLFLKDICFILLQLIHTFKILQTDGTEEIDYDLDRMLLAKTDLHKPPSLILLPSDRLYLGSSDIFKSESTNKTSLCQAALKMMLYLLQVDNLQCLNSIDSKELTSEVIIRMFVAIGDTLSLEKASSLSHAKNLLEYMLWGPVDILYKTTDSQTVNMAIKRWLDLQRAQNLKSLVASLYQSEKRSVLSVYDEYQLQFLIQANIKSIRDLIAKL